MREGKPLLAPTPRAVARELVGRVLGPDSRDAMAVLEWADGAAAIEVVAQQGLSSARLEQLVRRVRAVGAQTPLSEAVRAELATPGAETEQHRRVRRLLESGPRVDTYR